jgi:endonuclease YncB( thermonuclease family)
LKISPAPSSLYSAATIIDVLHNGQAELIRLNGIDCPEQAIQTEKEGRNKT